jgi:hypothetical protein
MHLTPLPFAGLPVPLRGTELGYEDCTQLCYDSNYLGDAFVVRGCAMLVGLPVPIMPPTQLFIRPLAGARIVWWYSGKGQTGPGKVGPSASPC